MVLTVNGLQYHIQMKEWDVGKYVFVPGDPARTDLIASYFDDAKLVAHDRNIRLVGYLAGIKVSVTSTGRKQKSGE